MILVTGATGFIGSVLIRHLSAMGKQVRTLIRPSKKSPNLPRGVPIEVAVSSLRDERGLRAAMKGVDTVYHLAGIEGRGSRADLMDVDIMGTQAVARAAAEASVDRIIFLSHLGADRASAYPVLKTKAIAESYIRQSKVDFTIFRSAIVYGKNDHFTTGLGILLHALPGFFIIPGDGSTLIQPIWVEDLVTCMTWALDDPATRNQVFEVGGPEYIPFQKVLEDVMASVGVQRWITHMGPAYLRSLTVFMEHTFPAFPVSVFWLDYLAANRTCSLDTVPRVFGLMPARFAQRIDYLKGLAWQKDMWKMLLRRNAG
jgi:uncharacterized protein YbjT (DUF2867 family)